MDLPMHVAAAAPADVSFVAISAAIADFSPVVATVRRTWSAQTLSGLREGKVAVPDEVINESLAQYGDETAAVYDIAVASQGDGKLRLTAQTRQFGKIDFLCRIDQFEHNRDISLLKFTVLEKDLPDQGLLSWIMSRVSLSMVEKMVGRIDLGEKIRTKIVRDTVAIDFHEALSETEFGKVNLLGYKLSDALIIESAEPKEGHLELKTSLDMPETVKSALQNIIK